MTLTATRISDDTLRLGEKIMAWREDPVSFSVEVVNTTPWKKQRDVLMDMAVPGAKVTVKSGHGVGKSRIEAVVFWWQMLCWDDSVVLATAPTAHQLYDVLWAEIARLRKQMPIAYSSRFKQTKDEVRCVESRETWFGVARTARPEAPEGLQGIHNALHSRLLIIADEGSGVPDQSYEVLEGALTNDHSRALIMGNPTRAEGYFFLTHTMFKDIWACHTIASTDAPARLISPGYAERIARRYGKESNVYRVRVEGLFPKSSDDTVVPLEWAEASRERDVPANWFIDSPFQCTLSLDVALKGGDDSVLTVRQGHVILGMFEWNGNNEEQSVAKVQMIAQRIYAASMERWPNRKIKRAPYFPIVFLDNIGVGVKVEELLDADPRLQIIGVNVGNNAKSPTYNRLRDEIWFMARFFFQNDKPVLAPPPPPGQEALATLASWNPLKPYIDRELAERLINELATPKYEPMEGGKIKVEGKKEMRKRLGIEETEPWSPDAADSLNLSFFMPPPPKEPPSSGVSYDRSDKPVDLMEI